MKSFLVQRNNMCKATGVKSVVCPGFVAPFGGIWGIRSKGGRKRSWEERQVSPSKGCRVWQLELCEAWILTGDFEAKVQSERSWRKIMLVARLWMGQVGAPGGERMGVLGPCAGCSLCARPGCWLRKWVGLKYSPSSAFLAVECISSGERAPFYDLAIWRVHKDTIYASPGVRCCKGGKEVRRS